MGLKHFSIIRAVILMITFSSAVSARDEFEKVEVLDHPRYSFMDRFHLDLDFTFLPLDAYYKPVLAEVAASYQWGHWLVLEPARFGYSLHNFDTGFKQSIENTIQNLTGQQKQISEQTMKNLRYKASSGAYLNMLYSKSNLFNRSVVYHNWQAGAAFSYYDFDGETQMGLDLVMRVRFFINDDMTFNIRGGHTLGFKSDLPKNITFLGLGFAYGF